MTSNVSQYIIWYEIFSSKCLKIRVTIKSADQINKACRLNYSKNLDHIYFISTAITQPKLIANSRAIKCQKIEKFVRLI